MSMFIGGFLFGGIVGLVFGPDSEREHRAKVDGWISGYTFAREQRTRASTDLLRGG